MARALKLITNNEPRSIVPSLRSVSPEVARIEDKRDEIGAKREALRQEGAALRDAGNQMSGQVVVDHQPSKTALAVAALLGDPPPTVQDAPESLKRANRLSEITAEIRVLEEAEAELTRRLQHARRKASLIVCDQVRDHHSKLARNLVEALKAVHEANRELTEFSDQMHAQEVSWFDMNTTLPRFLGDPKNLYSPLAQFFFEAVELGWITQSDLPPEFVQK